MKTCFAVIAVVSFLTLSGSALSQKHGSSYVDQGTLRFHLDVAILSYKYDAKAERSGPFHMLWSSSPYMGFGVSYAIIDRLLLGARVMFGYTDGNPDEHEPGENYTVRFGFVPYVEYLFFPLRWLSPFVAGQLGVEGTETPNNSNWTFITGPGGGIHFFLNPKFSMDLTSFFCYHGGHRKRKDDRGGDKKDPLHAISLSVLFGLSGWI